LCAKCGLPLPAHLASSPTTRCGLCDALAFTARSCGAYAGALEASIWFLKSHPHLCGRLRRLVGKTFSEHQAALAADVIVPVPLHRRRRRERGFNQAEMVARVVAREGNLPLAPCLLTRTKPTERHRAGLDARDRARSVTGAFHVPRPQAVAGRAVLLIDDLFTTGSTLRSAAESLLKAGAIRVSVMTVARVAPAIAGRRR